MKKNITINGNNFSDLKGFYTEIENVLSKHIDWKSQKNVLNLNDILRGGFGVHNSEEPITLIWENSEKSKTDLDFPATIKLLVDDNFTNPELELNTPKKIEPLFTILTNIIKAHKHIELIFA